MKIMAIDLGDVRTGIAFSDITGLIAGRSFTITERNRQKLTEKICALIKEEQPEQVVLGLPVNMDGTEGESAQNAREIGALLEEAAGLPVAFVDERGTTVTAHGYLNETNTRGKRRKAVVDAVAATVILQNYLDYRRLHKPEI